MYPIILLTIIFVHLLSNTYIRFLIFHFLLIYIICYASPGLFFCPSFTRSPIFHFLFLSSFFLLKLPVLAAAPDNLSPMIIYFNNTNSYLFDVHSYYFQLLLLCNLYIQHCIFLFSYFMFWFVSYANPYLPFSLYLFLLFFSKLPVLAAAPDMSFFYQYIPTLTSFTFYILFFDF